MKFISEKQLIDLIVEAGDTQLYINDDNLSEVVIDGNLNISKLKSLINTYYMEFPKSQRGKVAFNDGDRVIVEVEDAILEYWKGEHNTNHFPVGEEVTVINGTMFKDATEGCTYLTCDWFEKKK